MVIAYGMAIQCTLMEENGLFGFQRGVTVASSDQLGLPA